MEDSFLLCLCFLCYNTRGKKRLQQTVLHSVEGYLSAFITSETVLTLRKKESFHETKRSLALALSFPGFCSACSRPAAIHACYGRIFPSYLLNRTSTLCQSQPHQQSQLSWRARHG